MALTCDWAPAESSVWTPEIRTGLLAKEKMDIQNVYYIEDKYEIISLLERINKPGDVILLKASNGMKFYDLAEEMITLWKRKN